MKVVVSVVLKVIIWVVTRMVMKLVIGEVRVVLKKVIGVLEQGDNEGESGDDIILSL